MKNSQWFSFLLCIILACAGNDEPKAIQPKQEAIRQAIIDVKERHQLVGISATILHKGKIVFSEGFGWADAEHQIPVMPDKTLFQIASVTKAFTGITLLKLYEQGRIDLDAPIQKYLPNFPQQSALPITPRLLAHHLGGIRHYKEGERTPDFLSIHYDSPSSVITIFQNDTLEANPGSRYLYSSYSYNLLAALMEAASDTPYLTLVEQLLLKPAKLTRTRCYDTRFIVPHRARNYSFFHPQTSQLSDTLFRMPAWDLSYNFGGGNMLATTEELAQYGRQFITPGLLKASSLDLLYQSPAAITSTGDPTYFSFGWYSYPGIEGKRRIYISGSIYGAQAAIQVYPDDELVIAIASNTWGKGENRSEIVADLPNRIASIMIGRN